MASYLYFSTRIIKLCAGAILSSSVLLAGGCAHTSNLSGVAADITANIVTGQDTDQEARLQAALDMLAQDGFEGVVAVSRRGQGTIYRGYGQSAAHGVPGEDTQFDMGSITKTITATLVMKLVEQGEITIDTQLKDIFVQVPADKAGITVHQLLTHSAGFVEAVGRDFEELGREDFISRVFESLLQFEPGQEYRYSNVGYSMLAAIIEKRTGKTYQVYLAGVLAEAGIADIGYMDVFDAPRSMLTRKGEDIPTASWGGSVCSGTLLGMAG
ncbi:MAG: hypothetical protein COA69_05485 [Robiginitomaculum sp.]|nr:MAG: hypothetical protein COA69_05485 [Robiginitomaculum sp.]